VNKTHSPEASAGRKGLQGESGRFHQSGTINSLEGDPPAEQTGDLRSRKHIERLPGTTNYFARTDVKRGYVTRNESNWKVTPNVSEIHKQMDALSRDFRLLDTRIQGAHWRKSLIQN
jgi:hypothetical protein